MTDSLAPPAPDERMLRAHLEDVRFRAGVDAGRWRLLDYEWPKALIAIEAAPRPKAPTEFVLSFELSGYPQAGPTACPWDVESGTVLGADKRPTGERVGYVFRSDWEEGRALYAPWDRVALTGHPDWPSRYPREAWNSTRDLSFYLERVHELLSSDDYEGIRAA